MANEIQVWGMFERIPVNKDVMDTSFRVRIEGGVLPQALPVKLEEEIQRVWATALEKSPKTKDNPVTFLSGDVTPEKDGYTVTTNVRGFRHVLSFNRTMSFADRVEDLKEYKLLHLSTQGHVLVKGNDGNDKIVYGVKTNQFKQRSGFLGFPDVANESVEVDGVRYLNLDSVVFNRAKELQQFREAISKVEVTGMTYVGRPEVLDKQGKLLRGVDLNFLLTLEGVTAEEMAKSFAESEQFANGLHVTNADPYSQRDFIRSVYQAGHEMSPYAMGCAVSRTNALFGREGAQLILDTIKEMGYKICIGNETNYFA